MLTRIVPLAFALALFASPAMAGQCPADIAKIDAALAENTSLSDDEKATVTEMRNKGEELHNSGAHAESVAVLAEAKAILGIE
jgi:hypothetical protein